MANETTITGLPSAASAQLTDKIPCDQGATTVKETWSQVLTLFNSNIQIAESQVTNLTTDLSNRLIKTNNLSDVTSATSSATNLGLGTGNSPTFTGLTLSGVSASSLVSTNASSVLQAASIGSSLSFTANTLGISATYPGQTSIITLGTISTGTWNGSVIGATYGGTGINNASNTITLGGNILTGGSLTLSGAHSTTFTITGDTSVTFPTSGTLLTSANAVSSIEGTAGQVLVNGTSGTPTIGAIVLTLPQSIATGSSPTFTGLTVSGVSVSSIVSTNGSSALQAASIGSTLSFVANTLGISATYPGQTSIITLGTVSTGTWNGSVVGSTYGGTGVNNGSSTITIGGNLTLSGAFTTTFTITGNTSVTFPTSGTLLTSASAVSSTTGTANQVLVNGTSGTPTVGAITLTLPQSIATASSPTFTGLTLSGLSTNVLVYSNGSKALSSTTLSSNFASFSGTLDTVQDIQTSSTPQFAKLGLSVAAGSQTMLNIISTVTGTAGTLFGIVSSITGNFTSGGGNVNAINAKVTINTTGTVDLATGLYIDPGVATSGTCNAGYGIHVLAPVYGTTKCAIYGANLAIGTYTGVTPPTNGAVISGNVAIGANAVGTGANLHVSASNACILLEKTSATAAKTYIDHTSNYNYYSTDSSGYFWSTGSSGVGTGTERMRLSTSGLSVLNSASIGAAIDANYILYVSMSLATGIGTRFTGSITGQSGTICSAFYNSTTVQPSSSLVYGIAENLGPTFNSTSAAITNAYGKYINMNYTGANAITTSAALFIDSGSSAGAGGLTTSYGIYVAAQSAGTTKICAFFAGPIQIGVNTTGSGTALIGASNCPASTLSAPYNWLKFISPDGSTVYVPAWK